MSIVYVNTGTSPNSANGDTLRLAFGKINQNFQYLDNTQNQLIAGTSTLSVSTSGSVIFPDGTEQTTAYTGTTVNLESVASHILPAANLTYDLGSTSSQWRSLYVGTSTIYIGGVPLTINTSGVLVVNGNPIDSQTFFDQSLSADPLVLGTGTNSLTISSNKISLNSKASDSFSGFSGSEYSSAQWETPSLDTHNIIITGTSDIYMISLLDRLSNYYGNSTSLIAEAYQNVTCTVNGDTLITVTDIFESGENEWTVIVNEPPPVNPTEITEIQFDYEFTTGLVFDNQNYDYAIVLDNENFEINTRRDIRLESGDDIYIDGYSNMRLRNRSSSNEIAIQTDWNNGRYEWRFEADGNLTFPDSTSQSTAWTGNAPGLSYTEANGTSEIGVTADIFDFGDGKTIDMQNSNILFTGSTITGLNLFNQDLNKTDNVTFNQLELFSGQLNVTTGSGFDVVVTDNESNNYQLSLSTSGVLTVPGETVFNGNVYGGVGNRLWLGGDDNDGTPNINIPDIVEGTSTSIQIQNQLGGGVQIETEFGNWTFDNNGDLTSTGTITVNAVQAGSITLAVGGNVNGQGSTLGNFSTITAVTFVGELAGSLVNGTYTVSLSTSGSITVPGTLDSSAVTTDQLRTSEVTIALGTFAGQTSQSVGAVAIGYAAGLENQGIAAIGIGYSAGSENQESSAVAIGYGAGSLNQGYCAIAIGYTAGTTNQSTSSIIINASGAALESSTEGLFIAPVRNLTNAELLFYNTSTKEITYSNNIVGINDISVSGILDLSRAHETVTTSSTATSTVDYDCSNGQIFFHTSTGTVANWTANFTNLSLASNKATAVSIVVNQGNTGYYPNAVQIGGAAQTLHWQGNSTPTASSDRTDVITFTILNNDNTYLVLGQLTGF